MIAYAGLYLGQAVLARIDIGIHIQLSVIYLVKAFVNIRQGADRRFYLVHAGQAVIGIKTVRPASQAKHIAFSWNVYTQAQLTFIILMLF